MRITTSFKEMESSLREIEKNTSRRENELTQLRGSKRLDH